MAAFIPNEVPEEKIRAYSRHIGADWDRSAKGYRASMLIPIGYMLKKVVATPDWMGTPAVTAIHSVSSCVSACFLDYMTFWRHNGWWFFDEPTILRSIADQTGLDWNDFTLFYYEVFDKEYDESDRKWRPIVSEDPINLAAPFSANVTLPVSKRLSGYDVVTFFARTSPECSPLSCNSLARGLPVNRYCLFDDLETALQTVEDGRFAHSEPGPFRIVAVYTIESEGR